MFLSFSDDPTEDLARSIKEEEMSKSPDNMADASAVATRVTIIRT